MVKTYYPQVDPGVELAEEQAPITVEDMNPYKMITNIADGTFDGDKFWNGFGTTYDLEPDLYTLRARSSQLFTENPYARGILRRIVTNVINTGLSLESTIIEDVLRAELGEQFDTIGDVNDWQENVENRYQIYSNNPGLSDYYGRETVGSLQRSAYFEALTGGDCLLVLHQDRRTGLPKLQIIRGDQVDTPALGQPGTENRNIVDGVELDKDGRHIAYWVTQDDNTSKRIPAWGPRSKRRIAWLMYGTEKRQGAVRGLPILSIILQSLKEIDRYKDSEQRAAVVNSIVAMFIKKTDDKMGTRPLSGGAVRRETVNSQDDSGSTRTFEAKQFIPGLAMEELQKGEEPVSFNNVRPNVNFAAFEQAIINGMAWALEIPPGILTLSFQRNYSGSRGEINEYKIFLNMVRSFLVMQLPRPQYEAWFLSMALQGKIDAPGFLEAWRSPTGYDVAGAWLSAEFGGAIKPAVDMLKEAKAYELAVNNGFCTREKAARELYGMKYSKAVKRLAHENEQLKEANAPLAEAEPAAETAEPTEETIEAVEQAAIEAAEAVVIQMTGEING